MSFQDQNLRGRKYTSNPVFFYHIKEKEENVLTPVLMSTQMKAGNVPSSGASLRELGKWDQREELEDCRQGVHTLEANTYWLSSKGAQKDICLPSFPTQMISSPSGLSNSMNFQCYFGVT